MLKTLPGRKVNGTAGGRRVHTTGIRSFNKGIEILQTVFRTGAGKKMKSGRGTEIILLCIQVEVPVFVRILGFRKVAQVAGIAFSRPSHSPRPVYEAAYAAYFQ